jgi:hypothetical protein
MPQFLMGCYYSVEIVGPEVIMTTIPELTGRHAYGMYEDSISVSLQQLFAVQHQLMSGARTHLSALGYVERVIWA